MHVTFYYDVFIVRSTEKSDGIKWDTCVILTIVNVKY